VAKGTTAKLLPSYLLMSESHVLLGLHDKESKQTEHVVFTPLAWRVACTFLSIRPSLHGFGSSVSPLVCIASVEALVFAALHVFGFSEDRISFLRLTE
jgi:hypothetical protein